MAQTKPTTQNERIEKFLISYIKKQKAPIPAHQLLSIIDSTEIRKLLKIEGEILEPYIRQWISSIRRNSKCPILSNSRGYYYSSNKKDIQDQIYSLRLRAQAIMDAADGLEKLL